MKIEIFDKERLRHKTITSFKRQQMLIKNANITYNFGCDNLLQNSVDMWRKIIKKNLRTLLNGEEK